MQHRQSDWGELCEMSENYCTNTVMAWCDPNQCGADQRLPLSQAMRSGNDHALEQLLRAKANPMLTEQGCEAPLSLAVQTGTPNYVRLLLQSIARDAGWGGRKWCSFTSHEQGDGPRYAACIFLSGNFDAIRGGPQRALVSWSSKSNVAMTLRVTLSKWYTTISISSTMSLRQTVAAQ